MPACTPLGVKSSSSVASWSPPEEVADPHPASGAQAAMASRAARWQSFRTPGMMAIAMSSTPARRSAPPIEERGSAAYVAEFLGTFLLVLFVALVVIANSPGGLGVTDWAVIGLVHLLVLMVLVNALGGTSGAHFNPAIT